MTSTTDTPRDDAVREAVTVLRSYWKGRYFSGVTDTDCEKIEEAFAALASRDDVVRVIDKLRKWNAKWPYALYPTYDALSTAPDQAEG